MTSQYGELAFDSASSDAKCEKYTALMKAASNDATFNICQLLLQAGADVHAQDSEGSAPLHYAAHNGSVACIGALIDVQASLELLDDDGDTALHTAAAKGHADCISILCYKGLDVDTSNGSSKYLS